MRLRLRSFAQDWDNDPDIYTSTGFSVAQLKRLLFTGNRQEMLGRIISFARVLGFKNEAKELKQK